ncbi:histidine kinase dimerization/phospho-acceptor domain-containing protein [Pseudomonas sp. DSP3-2-2]|uniref:histidine kinase dimerization/phospho-acceptor domain-containing protein n=1 Tax=unclassified Pseudomonas TaxID=196821 RepID=UPI003CEEAB9F
MRLGDFILENIESILQQWEDFATTIARNSDLNSLELRAHVEKMLGAIATDLITVQMNDQHISKSHGAALGQHDEIATDIYAITPLMAGSSIDQIVAQYRVLRMSVLMKWMQRIKSGTDFEVEDMLHFNESVDQAVARSIARQALAAEQARAHFLGTLGHDLRTHLGAILLSADVLLHRKDIGAESAKAATRIHTSVQRADEVVGNLLTFQTTRPIAEPA